MSDTAQKIFVAGLRDAYAMHKQAKDMMPKLTPCPRTGAPHALPEIHGK